ncbi:MBL fold metallo-hydrolase [Labilibacter marinus]|uniref:MBL fold metallo-hydrolase n=1 Tax=Labilibacter marinus TaxID=1477105 RepID=UPI0008341C81|nr:MBL fold metallo-hydrolase [Labilibacter marinus]
MLKIHPLTYNPWQENTYIISAENGDCIIIDPGCLEPKEQEHLVSYITEQNLKPVRLINTHLHLDHVFGNRFVCEHYNLGAEAHKDDEFWIEQTVPYAAQMGFQLEQNPPALKGYLEHKQVIEFGGSTIEIFHIPGHSPGGCALYMEKENSVIAGDVLFRESIGRSDLPGGDFDTLIAGIKEHLLTLPDETVVYSGHGPSSTIAHEKIHNQFL